ncbi:MAG TPA: SDR family oxidoreductase [Candidatus Limnocylindrales bacterium]|nr:SDR family oxidoreductase [Candidatus Limnocylindrales bacterium]
MTSPSDRVVLVSGASGALGRAAVAGFAADGARFGLIGTDAGRLADVAGQAGLAEDRWLGATADLRHADQVRAAVTTIENRFGRIDVALHLVGGFVPGAPVTELEPADLAFMLDQHLWSTLYLAQAVVPGMVERRWGRILAVTSFTTATTPARAAIYATSKTAQETLLKVLAKEVGGYGVTVNVVAVRQIDTDHAREREPSPKNATWTTPEEIVAAFRHLASDEAAAINGARIPLDGRS